MKASFFVFIVGFITTAFGVGGVENSITNTELAQATMVAMVGLAIMGCGTQLVSREA